MFPIIMYVLLSVAIAFSVFMGWRRSSPQRLPALPIWRRRLLHLGLIGNTASLILFLVVVFNAMLISKGGVSGVELHPRVSVPLTVAPLALGAFGRRVPRVLVILNALVLTFIWVDLAASSR